MYIPSADYWYFPLLPYNYINQPMPSDQIKYQSALISYDISPQCRVKTENFNEFFEQELEKYHKKSTVRVWSPEEDQILMSKVKQGLSYKQISNFFIDKGPSICQRRFLKLQKKQKSWPKETEIEIKNMKQVQKLFWTEIRQKFPMYSLKQLREHYKDYLQKDINNVPWTLQEDKLLWEEVEKLGKKWKQIAYKFEGRTELQLKNRYYKSLVPIGDRVRAKM